MGKILQAFVSDQLHVDAVTEKNRRHKHLCEQAEQLQDKLEEKLNDEEKELLQKLTDTIFDECYCHGMNQLERGYCLGVLMTMEVFQERDSFFGDEE